MYFHISNIFKTIFIVTNISPFTLPIDTPFSVPVPCVSGGFEDSAFTFVEISATSADDLVAESCERNDKCNFVTYWESEFETTYTHQDTRLSSVAITIVSFEAQSYSLNNLCTILHSLVEK